MWERRKCILEVRITTTSSNLSKPHNGAARLTESRSSLDTVDDPEVGAAWTAFNGSADKHEWTENSSGGGFAFHFDAPEYQKDALATFFKDHNPRWPYFTNGRWSNGTGRYSEWTHYYSLIMDIFELTSNQIAMDEAFLISPQVSCSRFLRSWSRITNVNTAGRNLAGFWRNAYSSGAGTSASTPIWAALINRINEDRLRAGKNTLGFINPTLYEHPEILNDVTAGKNGYCNKDEGFEAVEGWVSDNFSMNSHCASVDDGSIMLITTIRIQWLA